MAIIIVIYGNSSRIKHI